MKKTVYLFFKRALDFILALAAMLVLSPLFAVIAVAVRLDSKGPVFFCQRRAGKGRLDFKMVKFRTMRQDTPHDTATHLLNNADSYITRVGALLRKSESLDELPQLWNIVRGDMAIVGPRPALWNQFDLLDERDKYGANDVRPGLTGWAQINGRDELPIAEKAALDGEYVRKMSLGFDLKCIVGTVVVVVRREGVVEGGTGAMDKQKKS